MADDKDNGWRGAIEARVTELERRVLVVETHPFVCPQIVVAKDHEERLRKLEAMRWQIGGMIAVVQAIGIAVIYAMLKGLLK